MSTVLTDMRLRLQEAYGAAEAAATCARVGQIGRGVEIANGADDPIRDTERLLAEAARQARASAEKGEPERQASSNSSSDRRLEFSAGETIDAAAASEIIRLLLHQACKHLHRAVGIARAAEIRAKTSHPSAGIRLVLEVEPLLYDVKHFINTASILNRMSNPSGRGE